MLSNRKLFALPCVISVLSLVPAPPEATHALAQPSPLSSHDGSSQSTTALQWTTVSRGFEEGIWGEQEKANNRITFTQSNRMQAEIRLRDGDTGVVSSDTDRERAELFLFYKVIDTWFKTHPYVRLTYELKLGSDFDVDDLQRGSRRIFQIKSAKGSGKPVFDVNIEDGIMQIRHNPTPNGSSSPVVLAEGPAPDPKKGKWLPMQLEAHFTDQSNGYLRIRAGNLTAVYNGPTQHGNKFNNFKIGEYRYRRYSSGDEPHLVRNAWLRVGK